MEPRRAREYFLEPAREEEYVAYCTSMYLLQDSTEGLCWHRRKGFAADPMHAYIEFWGVMQTVIIQQDSIAELTGVVTGSDLDTRALPAWSKLRILRSTCAGHLTRRDLPKGSPRTRSFMGRMFGGYESLKYEQWEHGVGTTHPEVNGWLFEGHVLHAPESWRAPED